MKWYKTLGLVIAFGLMLGGIGATKFSVHAQPSTSSALTTTSPAQKATVVPVTVSTPVDTDTMESQDTGGVDLPDRNSTGSVQADTKDTEVQGSTDLKTESDTDIGGHTDSTDTANHDFQGQE